MGILKDLEVEYDLEIVDDFLSHFSIMHTNIEPLIIDLDKEDKYADNIGELFKVFNNIKSASAYLKLKHINTLAETISNILGEIKDKKGPATAELIDWLLVVSDQFAAYHHSLEHDEEYFAALNPLVVKIPKIVVVS